MGMLNVVPALDRPDLLAPPVERALRVAVDVADVQVAPIDPTLADTAEFCAAYGVELGASANCVIVRASRGQTSRLAACVVCWSPHAGLPAGQPCCGNRCGA